MTNSLPVNFWLRLDNAAKLFPAVQDKNLTSVFRITAILKQPVRIRELMEALHFVELRFPYFKLKLKTGFFWYYLEHSDQPIKIDPDFSLPCRSFGKDELMLRVLVKGNRMSVEFSHIITDGAGAFEFLKALLISYFNKCQLPGASGLQHEEFNHQIHGDELEDAYNRYFKKINSPKIQLPKAFHLPFSLKKGIGFDVLSAVMPLRIASEKAKAQGVSLTVYLIAVYIFSLQEIHQQLSPYKKRRSKKSIRVQVPLNLRRIFPSVTMRNFSLFVLTGIDLRLGHYTFEEIIKVVYHQMQLETDKKLINKIISRNVGGEKNPMVRSMPLFLKSIMLSRLYREGANQYSGVFSNYGKAELPSPVGEQIEHFLFVPPPPNKKAKINCGAVGFMDDIILSFGSVTESRELEKRFLTFLVREGIPVRIINH